MSRSSSDLAGSVVVLEGSDAVEAEQGSQPCKAWLISAATYHRGTSAETAVLTHGTVNRTIVRVAGVGFLQSEPIGADVAMNREENPHRTDLPAHPQDVASMLATSRSE